MSKLKTPVNISNFLHNNAISKEDYERWISHRRKQSKDSQPDSRLSFAPDSKRSFDDYLERVKKRHSLSSMTLGQLLYDWYQYTVCKVKSEFL